MMHTCSGLIVTSQLMKTQAILEGAGDLVQEILGFHRTWRPTSRAPASSSPTSGLARSAQPSQEVTQPHQPPDQRAQPSRPTNRPHLTDLDLPIRHRTQTLALVEVSLTASPCAHPTRLRSSRAA